VSADKRPIAIDDIYRINSVEDPRVSPDGQWVAFVRVTIDRMENGYKRNIWLWPTVGGEPRQLTRSGKDFYPRWSPDGRSLALVSARDGKPQIYVLPVEAPGGEARAVTSMPNGAISPAWSPDGTQIAFLASLNAEEREKEARGEKPEPPSDKLEGKHRKERQEEDEKKRLDPYPVLRIPFRAGTAFLGDRYTQVYVINAAEAGKPEDNLPRRLTDIDANHEPPAWSPDGQFIYTSRQVDISKDEPFRDNSLFRIRLSDGVSEQITDDQYVCYGVQPSPDGQWLAYIRFPRHERSVTEHINRLAIQTASGGEARDLNVELDESALDYFWMADSSAIVFNTNTRGDCPIRRVSPQGGAVETLSHGRFKSVSVTVGPRGEAAYTASTPSQPIELYTMSAGGEAQQVTHFNKEWLESIIIQNVHELKWTSPDGNEVQGWYLLPVSYEEGRKYPLVVNIHGGPHVMWGPSEASMFHEWQTHAAQGYVVFFCNPRGSDGYGEAFIQALHAAWGDVAFKDVMSGVDALLAKGFVDADRMAVTGGSYGGYMTAWVIGHTDRFKCAVSQRGVYNLLSFYGTSDVPSLISGEFSTEPWEGHDVLWKHSPLAYAHQIKTPLLILHAENDYRVPIEQAEQLFAYVRRSGGTVEFIRFPRDGHELTRSGEPDHRVSHITHQVNWFNKYLMPEVSHADR